MWKAFFLGLGIFMILLGAQFLAVERLSLRIHDDPPPMNFLAAQPQVGPNKVINTQPWWPWSLMSTGAVTCIYSFTLPKRIQGQ